MNYKKSVNQRPKLLKIKNLNLDEESRLTAKAIEEPNETNMYVKTLGISDKIF